MWLILMAQILAVSIPCAADDPPFVVLHEVQATPIELSSGYYVGEAVLFADDLLVVEAGVVDDRPQPTLEPPRVFVFRRGPGGWFRESILAPPLVDSRTRVRAIDGNKDTLYFGCPHAMDGGAVFVYGRDGANRWSLKQTLLAPDPDKGPNFGRAISADGGWLAVSALQRPVTRHSEEGRIYLYRRDAAGVWQPVTMGTKPGGIETARGEFGSAIEIVGSTMLISDTGAVIGSLRSGAVFVFQREGGSWEHRVMLVPPDRDNSQEYGHTLALDADTCCIGTKIPPRTQRPAAVYVYEREEDRWVGRAKLVAPDHEPTDRFASALHVRGDRILVTAPGDTGDAFGSRRGSIYLYERTRDGWELRAKLALQSTDLKEALIGHPFLQGDAAFALMRHVEEDNTTTYAIVRFDISDRSLREARNAMRAKN